MDDSAVDDIRAVLIDIDGVLAVLTADVTGKPARTGKFRQQTLDDAGGEPSQVIDSLADVPGMLGLPAPG